MVVLNEVPEFGSLYMQNVDKKWIKGKVSAVANKDKVYKITFE